LATIEESIAAERARRDDLWAKLVEVGGPSAVPAAILNELKIYFGGRGIWVDKGVTSGVGGSLAGVAVGVLHSGSVYDDDLFEDGALYHYPTTLVPGRDASEIAATKAAARFGLPIFYSIRIGSSNKRDVKLAWVENEDDNSKLFLLRFGDTPPQRRLTPADERPFTLKEKRDKEEMKANRTKRQANFKFNVLKYYQKPVCAVCDVHLSKMLDAAHVVDVQHGGTDDERNGLILCANHHRVFDAHLFAIEPITHKIHCTPTYPASLLGIRKPALQGRHPHRAAVTWRWESWKKKHEGIS
jgi:hypothetical protein